jgi:DNA polymerase-4
VTDTPWTGRAILHVDMDAFFASVEQRDHPELRGKPVLVGGAGPRGVVAAASYEARVFGCRSAMPTAVARRLCPHAIIVRGNWEAYREASDTVMAILESYSPMIQPLSIDEAFIDVTGSVRLFGDPRSIAREIKNRVFEATRLRCSVGVGPNKFIAKVASDLEKPDGLTAIPADRIREALWHMPATIIPGLGPASEIRLKRLGVRTIGELAAVDEQRLTEVFGSYGARLRAMANGVDDRPVTPDRDAKSVGHERTFGEDLREPEQVRAAMLAQAEDVARRLRKHALRARTVTLKIRYGDFETITRAHTLDAPTDSTDTLWHAAEALFDLWIAREGFKPVRLIGVSASNMGDEAQLDLFASPKTDAKKSQVDRATDAIVNKFGKGAIRRAAAQPKKRRDE